MYTVVMIPTTIARATAPKANGFFQKWLRTGLRRWLNRSLRSWLARRALVNRRLLYFDFRRKDLRGCVSRARRRRKNLSD